MQQFKSCKEKINLGYTSISKVNLLRLREEFAKLEVKPNEEKSRKVDRAQEENFGFLGFEF